MSDRATVPADPGETGRDHTGLDDLRSNPEIRGPVAPHNNHGHANGHFALIYENRGEQLATAIPFVRDGLARGERVMYIVDDLSRADLIAALRDSDVDVDAALDSGQLSIHTVAETYRRDGEFDLDAARDLLATAMEDAVAEYEGFRVTAEETWLVGDPAAQREFLTCEAHVNDLLDGEDALALCQYDRDALPPDVIEDVIETHPHLIIDGTVCANDYYTPPAEYFGPADTARENDRKMSTLVDRAEARAALRTRERYERNLYEIVADPDRGFDAKLDALFELGRERFGLDHGGVARLDPAADQLEVRAITDDAPLDPGQQLPLSETHCRLVTDHTETVSVADAAAAGLADTASHAEFGVDAYLGTRLPIADGRDGSLFFFATEPRDEPFTDAERTFVDLMGQWVRYELERRQREQELRERTEHLNALVEATPECIKTVAEDGTLLHMNPAGLDMVEAPDESAVTGENVYDLIAPEDRDRFRAFNERICRGEHGTLEFDIIGLEGTRRHMESHAAPLERPNGTTVQVALTRDVTEQKERERELRRTERQFEAIFEDPNILVGLLDTDGTVRDINQTAMEYIDADLNAVTGDPFWETPWWGEDDEMQSDVRQWVERAASGEYVNFEADLTRSDGEPYTVEGVFRPVTNDEGEVVSVIVSDRDVTERIERERYQRELHDIVADSQASFEEKLDRLLELGRERFGLENGYFNRVDGDADEFEVVAANGPHDMIEPGAVDALSGTFCETHLDSTDPLATTDVCDAGLDYLRAHDEYGLEAYFASTVHVGGEEYGTLCFASERPREEPLTEAERTFLDLMGQCVSYELERNHREAQLEQKNDRLESFASMLAHELRNPVTIGQIYSQQLPADEAPDAVEYVTEAFDRIENIVDVMLVLTRGREAVGERKPVDLAAAAREAWDDVDAGDAALNVELTQIIEADETYVRQLFSNLLENAVEHGGRDVTVEVGEFPDGDGFYVADDGPGIPVEKRDRVFDEGFTTAGDNGGIGLGLAFVQKLADVYEWDYTVTESESGGARFEFRNVI